VRCEPGLCVGCNCMVGNMVKGICGNWIGIWNECWSVGSKVDVMMMIMMLCASGMYG
jgi:hypothetical protein